MTAEPLSLVVYGIPRPQGSKRLLNRNTGAMAEASPHLRTWRHDVTETARERKPPHWIAERNFALSVTFVFARPKAHFGTGRNANNLKPHAPSHPTTRTTGDLDKLCRSICDSLTAAGIWLDDSWLISLNATKRYGAPAEGSCALITIIPQ